jgi:hypothetical protein
MDARELASNEDNVVSHPQKDPNYLLVLLEEFHNESIVMACFV